VARLLSETEQMLQDNSTSIHKVPWLFNFHACGFMFHGVGLHDRDLGERFARVHWFVLVFVPIIPLGIYLVEKDPEHSTWRTRMIIVHRKLKLKGLVAVWGLANTVWLITSAWLITFGVVLAISTVMALGETYGW
jgi:hypothetical protein